MLVKKFIKTVIEDDSKFKKKNIKYKTPRYCPNNHYKHLCNSSYYYALIILRHYIKIVSDLYFSEKQKAKNIDLFMFTPSISSPMGPGSDSESIPIKFGKLKTFLIDSSQFGFEPLLLNRLDKVYCYLPSMRGEDYDRRHLNQFYHCEMEMRGKLEDLLTIVEGYIRILAETILLMENIINKISKNPKKTREYLKEILKVKKFPKITFDEAVDILVRNGKKNLVNFTKHGNDISCDGEIELMQILQVKTPIWLTDFDRDRVPFYQKPNPKNPEKTINADLLFPPIIKNSFGGEVVGSGQRQDSVEEMYESLKRQKNISPKSYEWYINLRRHPNYRTTSGFGLGIERFIAWSLGKDNIRDVILYPRIKNVKTYP
ncbi:amino acid--tRNA ligase-related protein [Desulfonauticus submarinus]